MLCNYRNLATLMIVVFSMVMLGSVVEGGLFSRNSESRQIVLHAQPQSPPQQSADQPEQIYQSNLERSRIQYLANNKAAIDQSVVNSQRAAAGQLVTSPYMRSGGLSAWGIIVVIVLVIMAGMIIYYGVMCYPLLCLTETITYITMGDSPSTTTGTPMQTYEDYDGKRNYSSRSTTPSKSHE